MQRYHPRLRRILSLFLWCVPVIIAGMIVFLGLPQVTSANSAGWGAVEAASVQSAAPLGQFLRLPGDVSGVVTSQTTPASPAVPLQNIEIVVTEVGGGFNTFACTNASGQYSMAGAPQDSDLIAQAIPAPNQCDPFSESEFNAEYYSDQPFIDDANVFQLVSPDFSRTDIDFALDYAGTVSGTVTANAFDASPAGPVGNVEVVLFRKTAQGYDYSMTTCTDGSGNYQFADVLQGIDLSLWVDPNSLSCGGMPTNLIKEYWNNQTTFDAATTFMLDANAYDVTGVDFVLDYGGTISGNIVSQMNSNGPSAPLQNISMWLFINGYDTQQVCSDSNGDYFAFGVPFDVNVQVGANIDRNNDFCGGGIGREAQWYNNQPNLNNADTIQVTALTPTQANINFTLDIFRTISGTVNDVSGVSPVGLPNLRVFAYSEDSAWDTQLDAISNGFSTCTAPDGSFLINDVPGDENIIVYTDGSTVCDNGVNSGMGLVYDYRPEYWQEAPDLVGATAIVMTDVTANTPGVDFTLDVGVAPVLTLPTNQDNIEGDTVSLQVVATDGDDDTLMYAASGLPAGLTINPDTGLISGNIGFDAATNSPYMVMLTVTENTSASLSDGGSFQWTVSESDPGIDPAPINLAATNIAPPVPIVPTFSWTHQTEIGQMNVPATTYGLYIVTSDSIFNWYAVFNTVDICNGTACEITPTDQLSAYGLLSGEYQWWVGADETVWSGGTNFDPATFTVSLSNAALPASMAVNPNEGRPTVTFTDDPNTLWVNVFIGASPWGNYFTWHERNGAGNSFVCMSGTCSMNIAWDAPAGTYQVWMQAWGPGGLSDGGTDAPGYPSWVRGPDLTLSAVAASLPTNLNVPNPSAPIPTFEWQHVDQSTWFHLIVTTDDYTLLYDQWWQAGDIMCVVAGDTCTVTDPALSGVFTSGTPYRFFVAAWGPGGFSTGGVADSGYEEGTFTP